jgi:hypothetical protein
MTNHNIESLDRERLRAAPAPLCYKIRMGPVRIPRSPTRRAVEAVQDEEGSGVCALKYPVRKGRRIGVGMVRTPAIR